ncbi:MAG: hypothetical protein CALGDGBN_02902 [Pseudomonadales bacterium]|nr:hypothetical protein [Pseudomonadales bacterium]
MSATRRFIAGAICPSCGGVDKLFVAADDAQMICECVACGFRDSRARDAVPGSAEYARGLGQTADETQAVRFVDP